MSAGTLAALLSAFLLFGVVVIVVGVALRASKVLPLTADFVTMVGGCVVIIGLTIGSIAFLITN